MTKNIINHIKKIYPNVKDIAVGKVIHCLSVDHEDKNPSMRIYDNCAYCHGCGFKITLNESYWTSEINEVISRIIVECKNEIPQSWALQRGYDVEILKQLNIGQITPEIYGKIGTYFSNEVLQNIGIIDKNNKQLWFNRIIIPFAEDYCSARANDPNSVMKVKFPKGMKKKILKFSGDDKLPIIVAEGETTAIALKHIYENYRIWAIGGTNSWNLLKNEDINEIILCMDNDEAGFKAEKEIFEHFNNKGIKIKKIEFSKQFNDFDDLHYKHRFNARSYAVFKNLDSVEDLIELDFDSTHILNNTNIFLRIKKEINKVVVDEDNAISTVLLTCFLSRVENSNPVSSNLLVNDDGGTGKDFIVSETLKMIPKDWWIKRTRITPTVLTYWKPVENWDGKILYLEDVSNQILNADVFKVMASGGSYATVVINQEAVDIEIIGKPTIIITSAQANPTPELARRFPICPLTQGREQTTKIIKKKLKSATSGEKFEYDKKITEALTLIKRINVKIPYAEELLQIFPKEHIIMRTGIDRFLDYIKASCSLHQFQREKDIDGFYLATGQDYNIAKDIFNGASSTNSGYPLSKIQKNIIQAFNRFQAETFSSKATIYDLEPYADISDRYLRDKCKELAELNVFKLYVEKDLVSNRQINYYKMNTNQGLKLPTFEEIFDESQKKVPSEMKGVAELAEHSEQGKQLKRGVGVEKVGKDLKRVTIDKSTLLIDSCSASSTSSVPSECSKCSVSSSLSNSKKVVLLVVKPILQFLDPNTLLTLGAYKKGDKIELDMELADTFIKSGAMKIIEEKQEVIINEVV